eukprot:UN06368
MKQQLYNNNNNDINNTTGITLDIKQLALLNASKNGNPRNNNNNNNNNTEQQQQEDPESIAITTFQQKQSILLQKMIFALELDLPPPTAGGNIDDKFGVNN